MKIKNGKNNNKITRIIESKSQSKNNKFCINIELFNPIRKASKCIHALYSALNYIINNRVKIWQRYIIEYIKKIYLSLKE